ncbi:ABC transporter ATP-binding protein [Plebeiibacterium sediminum]|uniref:ATP-binding cassette domain-containing protein n=1 Tax=Plebeiibacterium sediminum TaxID=2992112 RepID=A0AAE3M8A8_9BACT|nr:ATP-binding cassette domain-containing protein [Plebeiobacterium sediminum]MCW3789019.1 ATP-binding cassette domain-containing protein [Plebeiobacterium sediminum]
MIKCNDISLSFGKKKIFEHVSFHVEEGEFLTIKGESGTGKSSLLKMIQGYVPFLNGEISVKGELLTEKSISGIRNDIIWIPQNVNLPVKNGVELVQLMGLNNNNGLIESLLDQLGLESKILHKDFQKVSGGQKQRIIIAICLSINKPIVLMDEPTSSLDENAIQLLIHTMKSLKGKTILTASHNITWIENSDRIIELN